MYAPDPQERHMSNQQTSGRGVVYAVATKRVRATNKSLDRLWQQNVSGVKGITVHAMVTKRCQGQ